MDYKIPDKLTFKRQEVIKLTKLDGKVIDYWEKEFGGIFPVINKMGEVFYTNSDVKTILKIKDLMIVQRVEKGKIKKIITPDSEERIPENPQPQKVCKTNHPPPSLKKIKDGLKEILTILEKNG